MANAIVKWADRKKILAKKKKLRDAKVVKK